MEVKSNLCLLVSKFRLVHVVIDALDESSDREEDGLDFVSSVCSLGSQVKVLCTSRPATSLQTAFFREWHAIPISAREEDVKMFLEAQVQQQHRLQRHIKADPTLKDDIIQAIVRESQGM